MLKDHRQKLFDQHIGKMNTPRPEQVDALYEALLGIKLSPNWHWQGISPKQAISRLDALITLRGSIAHRVDAPRPVRKKDVRNFIDFVNRIAVKTSNAIRDLILRKTGKEPWSQYTYTSIMYRRTLATPKPR